MIPPKNHPRFRQLALSEFKHSFALASSGMFVSLHQRKVQVANRSPESITEAIKEIHGFFTKFESVLTDDIKAIFGEG